MLPDSIWLNGREKKKQGGLMPALLFRWQV
jgi:hypothetical protein